MRPSLTDVAVKPEPSRAESRLHCILTGWSSPKTIEASRIMAKSHEQMAEVVHNHRYHPRNAENRPQKAQKHRYERRKVRELMRTGEWAGDSR
jgi:hypothetical protein